MRIITCNVNGLRSAIKKSFFEWLLTQQADMICLQETRLHAQHLASDFKLPGYQAYFCYAEKKGYSGVAIYSRYNPDQVINQLGWPVADQEGRYLQLDFDDLSIVSLYLPSGTSGELRQQCKIEFMARYEEV
jgi:exodeoxyribonuclease-3